MSEEKKTYIAGIYNYCDRWCEKCKFTAYCLLFTNESKIVTQEILKPGESLDIDKIFEMKFDDNIEEFEEDIFDELADEEEAERQEESETEAINNHPLSKMADSFFDASHALIKKMDERYNFYALSSKRHVDAAFNDFFEEFEIFVWFHTLVVAKIKRAVSGKVEIIKEADEELTGVREYDMNGSAKIAVIALEKTNKALSKLFDRMPDIKEDISSLLVITGELLNMTEREFPGYAAFVRPGFDE